MCISFELNRSDIDNIEAIAIAVPLAANSGDDSDTSDTKCAQGPSHH